MNQKNEEVLVFKKCCSKCEKMFDCVGMPEHVQRCLSWAPREESNEDRSNKIWMRKFYSH